MMIRCIFATLIVNISLIFPSFSADNVAFVSPEVCQRLTVHKPRDDVEYKGGVDVKGRPVVPADIAPYSGLGVEDVISFLLILDIAKENRGNEGSLKQLNAHPELAGYLNLGQIIIKDGKVTLNGKPLAAQNRQVLNEFCLKSRNLP